MAAKQSKADEQKGVRAQLLMAKMSPGALAAQHFQLSLRHGFVLLVPTGSLVALAFLCYMVAGGMGAAPVVARATAVAGEWASLAASTVIFGALLLGVPALFFAALRIWPMRWLLRVCLAEPASPNLALGLAGTLLLFESPLLIAALCGARNKILGFSALASLPFLGGALWATWQLLKAEQRAATPESAG
ncbi:hypothetical protein [Hymenobacter nivis]|uniref:Uncharacterized protein n=1 Tax=Hymenobacter nivis TaxID=1850093 RepID=A0A502H1S0_9BACT|nr:hypothetical protein [Hymenobacter nivis]TPG67320.1 hypothetical protein EAH73_06245 [Hymenobacter nivis]